jgi:hypothetical protein
VNKKLRSAIFGLLISSAILLFISGRTWVSIAVTESGFPQFQLSMTGRDVDPVIAGCAWALVTSSLALFATRGILQKIVAVIATVLSVATAWSCWQAHGSASVSAVNNFVASAVGRQIGGLNQQFNALWLVSLMTALFCAVFSVVTFLSSSNSSQISPRYERNQDDLKVTPWQALDQGIDPTSGQ